MSHLSIFKTEISTEKLLVDKHLIVCDSLNNGIHTIKQVCCFKLSQDHWGSFRSLCKNETETDKRETSYYLEINLFLLKQFLFKFQLIALVNKTPSNQIIAKTKKKRKRKPRVSTFWTNSCFQLLVYDTVQKSHCTRKILVSL